MEGTLKRTDTTPAGILARNALGRMDAPTPAPARVTREAPAAASFFEADFGGGKSQNRVTCRDGYGAGEWRGCGVCGGKTFSILVTQWPFGDEMWDDSYSGETYKYTGHERDYDLGLDYMMARHYAYSLGRFMSPDPIYTGQGNLYTYVRNNPLNLVDPFGLADTDLRVKPQVQCIGNICWEVDPILVTASGPRSILPIMSDLDLQFAIEFANDIQDFQAWSQSESRRELFEAEFEKMYYAELSAAGLFSPIEPLASDPEFAFYMEVADPSREALVDAGTLEFSAAAFLTARLAANIFLKGGEIIIKDNTGRVVKRISLFGHHGGKWYRQIPHLHKRPGIGRHWPWE